MSADGQDMRWSTERVVFQCSLGSACVYWQEKCVLCAARVCVFASVGRWVSLCVCVCASGEPCAVQAFKHGMRACV